MKKLLLLIGTRKGAFVASSDRDRRQWTLDGPLMKGAQVNHFMAMSDGGTLVAAAKSEWWGPSLRMSRDLGQSWTEPTTNVRFQEGRGHSLARIWAVEEVPRSSGSRLYAGVDPGALFISDDRGETWEEVASLTDHPTRSSWFPGAGGLMVHGILADPKKQDRLFVAISAAGVFRSDDGGQSWAPKNTNVRADFLPNKLPEVGQCVHHLEMHPSRPEVLYQQNHCGVYRSDNAGDDWIDISEGLPSRFGFPLAVHPHDGDTIFVVPEESDESRMTPAGALRVYRSRDRGKSWEPLTNGLPQSHAHAVVLRGAMTTDRQDPVGVYVGTQGGQVLASRDEGNQWDVLFNWLPPVYSLETAVVG